MSSTAINLSVKSKKAVDIKKKRGEYQEKNCPYGYRKGTGGRLEPDKETAPVVKIIFEMSRDGYNSRQIAKELLEKNIPILRQRKASGGEHAYNVLDSRGIWLGSTIRRILRDERYIGIYVMGKSKSVDIGSKRTRPKDKKFWFKISNHPPSIVETTEKVDIFNL